VGTGATGKLRLDRYDPDEWEGRSFEGPSMQRLAATAAISTALLLPIAAPVQAAGLGVQLTSLSSPVKRGHVASASAHSGPQVRCAIKLVVNGQPISASGLGARYTNGSGKVSWSWTLPNSTPAGRWPVTVTCQSGSRSGKASQRMQVMP
jgi:hypothetical protein